MMELKTKSMLIKQVAVSWEQQYLRDISSDKQDVLDKLRQLDETATEDDVASIIGNRSWTRIKCDECRHECDAVVILGEPEDYDSRTAFICKQCLSAALALMMEGE